MLDVFPRLFVIFVIETVKFIQLGELVSKPQGFGLFSPTQLWS